MAFFNAQAYDFQFGDLFFNITSEVEPLTAEVTFEAYPKGNYPKMAFATIPPSVIDDKGNIYSVTRIGDNAFSHTNLAEIEIPYSVTSIGNGAFCNCASLPAVYIPESVAEIGDDVFCGCVALANVDIPNSVTSIGSSAFGDCVGLIGINLPNAITAIGDSLFRNCSGLTDIAIPNTIQTIGEGAFLNCTGLKSIGIPSAVTSIGRSAFHGCSGLAEINIPKSVSSVGDMAFIGCGCLKKIEVDADNASYTSADGVLFNKGKTCLISCPMGHEGVYSVPNGVTDVHDDAFHGCAGLVSIDVPQSVARIGKDAFYDCAGLAKIDVHADNANYSSADGVLFDKNKSMLICCPAKKSGDYSISNTVDTIGIMAFRGCAELTSVSIPNTVKIIGRSVFENCSGLTSVAIPNTVSSIGVNAFYGCTSLTSIAIPGSMRSIDYYAFGGCTGLESITCTGESPASFDVATSFETYGIPVYIPVGTFDSYYASDWWYFNLVESDKLTAIDDEQADRLVIYSVANTMIVENADAEISVYDVVGRCVANSRAESFHIEMALPKHGVYIVKVGDVSKKVFAD